jgi:hypothetical protein
MNRSYAGFTCIWLALIGLTIYFSLWAFTTIDVHRLERSAAVVSSSSATATHVSDERGERKVPVGGLESGERIYLERWEGRIVSVVDRASGRRLKTRLWPGRSEDRAYQPALGWSIILGVVWLVWSIALLMRRWRTARRRDPESAQR